MNKKQYWKEYYLKNREKFITRAKEQYADDPDKKKAYQRLYYKKNKKRIIAKQKLYNDKNYDRVRLAHADVMSRRRARLRLAESDRYKRSEVYNRFGGYCIVCDEIIDKSIKYPSKMSFSIHHIIPISKGGSNMSKNVAPAHLGCNIKVGNKVPIAAIPKVYYG